MPYYHTKNVLSLLSLYMIFHVDEIRLNLTFNNTFNSCVTPIISSGAHEQFYFSKFLKLPTRNVNLTFTYIPFVSHVFSMVPTWEGVPYVLGGFFCHLWLHAGVFFVPNFVLSHYPTTLLPFFFIGPCGADELLLSQHWWNLTLWPPCNYTGSFFHKRVLSSLVDSSKRQYCCVTLQHPCPRHGFGLILSLSCQGFNSYHSPGFTWMQWSHWSQMKYCLRKTGSWPLSSPPLTSPPTSCLCPRGNQKQLLHPLFEDSRWCHTATVPCQWKVTRKWWLLKKQHHYLAKEIPRKMPQLLTNSLFINSNQKKSWNG